MAAAKAYKKKPIDIANELVEQLKDSSMFSEINAVMPGFINIRLNPEYLAGYVNRMASDEKYGLEEAKDPETIIVDYGGANVAKPLHVGHLRAAVIGESIKRICRYMGHKTIGDVHLGDWGLQMGLIDQYTEFLGNKVVCHSIPIRPGRNLAIIVESAAVNYRQKKMGYNAARELYNRVQANLARKD